jgi:threonine/homoserine/homoserine lactone efflux protein
MYVACPTIYPTQMSLFLKGLMIGISMIIFIGPVFFYLLRVSIEYSWKSGVLVALGIIIGDVLISTLMLYGIQFNLEGSFLAPLLPFIFLLIGLVYLLGKNKEPKVYTKALSHLNFFNPFVFVVWFGLVEYQKQIHGIEKAAIVLAGVLIGIFVCDVLKVVFSHKLQAFTKPQHIVLLKRITGLVFIGFALKLFFHVF